MTLAYLFSDAFLAASGDEERPFNGRMGEEVAAGYRPSAPATPATPATPEDAALVARVRAGDVEAFRDVYMAHVEALVRFAARFVRPVEAATDVVQDVFAAVWTRRAEWEVRGAVRTYLYGAVRRRALAVIRDANVESRAAERALARGEGLGMGSPAVDQIRQMEQDELTRQVEHAIAMLPERQRTAVLLRWNDEMNAVEIGRVLGISDTAVRKLLLAARARIDAAIR